MKRVALLRAGGRDGRLHVERGTVAFINSDGSGLEIAVGNEFIGESNRPHPRLRPIR
jgi:hypothetical protein